VGQEAQLRGLRRRQDGFNLLGRAGEAGAQLADLLERLHELLTKMQLQGPSWFAGKLLVRQLLAHTLHLLQGQHERRALKGGLVLALIVRVVLVLVERPVAFARNNVPYKLDKPIQLVEDVQRALICRVVACARISTLVGPTSRHSAELLHVRVEPVPSFLHLARAGPQDVG
jgi:hypothetical protein